MADIIIHLIVPLLILLLICDKDKHIYIYSLLPLALFADIDVIYEHRAMLHNLFIPFALFILSYIVSEKKKIIFLFSAIYLFSHTILDIFNGGVKIFYPFYDKMFGVRTDIILTAETNSINYFFDIGFKDHFHQTCDTVNVITTGGMGILVLALILFLSKRYLYKQVITWK